MSRAGDHDEGEQGGSIAQIGDASRRRTDGPIPRVRKRPRAKPTPPYPDVGTGLLSNLYGEEPDRLFEESADDVLDRIIDNDPVPNWIPWHRTQKRGSTAALFHPLRRLAASTTTYASRSSITTSVASPRDRASRFAGRRISTHAVVRPAGAGCRGKRVGVAAGPLVLRGPLSPSPASRSWSQPRSSSAQTLTRARVRPTGARDKQRACGCPPSTIPTRWLKTSLVRSPRLAPIWKRKPKSASRARPRLNAAPGRWPRWRSVLGQREPGSDAPP
jgi:hypothetical protein